MIHQRRGVERWLSSLVCWLIFLGRLTFLEVLRSLEVTPLCHRTAALCPSDVGLGPNLSSLTIFQMNIDLNRLDAFFLISTRRLLIVD